MSDLLEKAIGHFQARYTGSMATSDTINGTHTITGEILFSFGLAIIEDFANGSKHRVVVIENLDNNNEIDISIPHILAWFLKTDGERIISVKHPSAHNAHGINTVQMIFSPKVYLYTNKLCCPPIKILDKFKSTNLCIEIIDESQMYKKSLFISYGGPDEDKVKIINDAIKSKGVKTYFFHDNKTPGKKLHRLMSEGVNEYDHVLLICSENSLNRPGVTNEIEQVLEREAREGGTTVLIPISLDRYVYDIWNPEKKDMARHIRGRVISDIDVQSDTFNSEINKIVELLK
jgi:hypothetical protein